MVENCTQLVVPAGQSSESETLGFWNDLPNVSRLTLLKICGLRNLNELLKEAEFLPRRVVKYSARIMAKPC